MVARNFLMAAVGLLAAGGMPFAEAATCDSSMNFCRSDTVTNVGGSPTVTGTGSADNGPVGTTISYNIGDQFGTGTGRTSLGADFTTTQTGGQAAPNYTAPDSGWNFYDDFRFSIAPPGSTSDTAVITLNTPQGLAVSSLEVRLFSTAGGVNAAPVLGAPVGGTVGGPNGDAWSTPFPGGSYAYTLPTGFAAGSYDLQIRGLASSGSSYGGTINFTPVPLPATLPLMLSGFGLFAGLRRRAQ